MLHYNEGYRSGDSGGGNGGRNGNQSGNHETLLYNAQGEVTEASTSNIFIAKDGAVATPPADRQILPGVTRQQLLDILRADGGMPVAERLVTLRELRDADEVWLSSATKEIAPVTAVDGEPVGDGKPGPLWEQAQTLFAAHRFDDS